MRLIRCARLSLLAVGLAGLVCTDVQGQQPPETPPEAAVSDTAGDTPQIAAPPAGAVPPQQVVIPVSDIPARADEVAANARRLRDLVEPQDAVVAIAEAIPDQARQIVELRTALGAVDPNRVSAERIEDQRVAWTEVERTLAGWNTVLQTRWTTLQAERTELRDTEAVWVLSRANAVSDEAPAGVLQRIDTILTSLSRAEAGIEQRSNALAVMIDRVSGGNEVVIESFDRLDTMSERAQQRLLTRDAEPVWRGLAIPDVRLFLTDIQQERQYWYTTLTGFVDDRQERFTLLGGIFVVAFVGSVVLRRWSRTWPADPSLDAARHVSSRPVSTALALTLASGAFVIPRSVGPFADVVSIVALVPVFRLGVGLAAPHILRLMYGVMTLAVLYLLTTFSPDGSVLRRLVMLILTAASIVGATWLIRRWRRTDLVSSSRTARVGLVGLQLATALLGVALVANLLGWFALSQLLLRATVLSAYGAVAWRVVALTMTAMVPLVPRSVVGRALPSTVRYEATFIRRSTIIIATVIVVLWTRTTLIRFRLFDWLWEQISLGMAFSLTAGGLELTVGRLLTALAILLLTFPLAGIARFVLSEEVLPRFPLPQGVNHTVVAIVNYTVVVVGLLLAGSAAGLTGTQLTVVFGALGVGIGFGLQAIVLNFVSGLILMFERPVKIGDRIEASGHLGIVTRIGMRASTIRSFDGAEVIVPNGDLISKEVTNWTLSDHERRVEIVVRVVDGSDVRQILEILRRLPAAHPDVLDEPAPTAFMTSLSEGSLDFLLLAWTATEKTLEVSSALNVQVYEALEQAGIRTAVPQRDLHVRSVDPGSALIVDGMASQADPVYKDPAAR